jgi:RNA polymerase primary sigma factor
MVESRLIPLVIRMAENSFFHTTMPSYPKTMNKHSIPRITRRRIGTLLHYTLIILILETFVARHSCYAFLIPYHLQVGYNYYRMISNVKLYDIPSTRRQTKVKRTLLTAPLETTRKSQSQHINTSSALYVDKAETAAASRQDLKREMLSTPKKSKRRKEISKQDYQLEVSMLNHDLLSKDEEYNLSELYHKAKQLQIQIDILLSNKKQQQNEFIRQSRNDNNKDFVLNELELDMNDEYDNNDDIDIDSDGIDDEMFMNLYNDRVATVPRNFKTTNRKRSNKATTTTYNDYFEYQQQGSYESDRIRAKGQLLERLDQTSRSTMASLLFMDDDVVDNHSINVDHDDVITAMNFDKIARIPKWNEKFVENNCDDVSINDLSDNEIVQLLNISGGRNEMEYILLEGAKARDTLIRSNLKLVSSICKKWARISSNKGDGDSSDSFYSIYSGSWDRPSLSEAIQEGVIGLTTAVERFDPSRGLRFSTYATYWITNSVRQCFQRSSTGCLKLPINYYDTRTRFKTLVRHYYEMDGSVPSIDILAREMGLTKRRLELILSLTQPLLSIDGLLMPRGTMTRAGKAGNVNRMEDNILLSDTLADTNQDNTEFGNNPMDRVELSFLRQQLEHAMAVELVPFERDVLRLRLGLDDGVTRTCREVAIVCGGRLKSSEIRTVERRALKKLRSPVSLATYKLLTYLDFADVDMKTITLT